MPGVAALPDGRLVIGYMQWWVATDATNTAFREITWDSPLLWQAGITDRPITRRGHASADGGRSWVPLPKRNEVVEADEAP